MVRERSAYRLMWPLVLTLLTALNVILAGDYMIRIADAGGEIGWFGLTRNELINWSIAFGLIVSGRILVVLLGDDETTGGGGNRNQAANQGRSGRRSRRACASGGAGGAGCARRADRRDPTSPPFRPLTPESPKSAIGSKL